MAEPQRGPAKRDPREIIEALTSLIALVITVDMLTGGSVRWYGRLALAWWRARLDGDESVPAPHEVSALLEEARRITRESWEA